MAWRTIGDFTRTFNHGRDHYGYVIPLNRSITFKNDTPNSVVSEISFCGYRDGDYIITVTATNGTQYRRLLEQAQLRGIPPQDSIPELLRQVCVRYSGIVPPRAISLFQAAQAVEPSFEEIRVQINGVLGINLPYMAPLPPPFVPSPQQIQARTSFAETETHARNILQAHAEHAHNDIIRERNIAERRFYPSAESADTCQICLTNPATRTCNEYNIVRSSQPTRRTRIYVCNVCEPTLRTQNLSNGMPKYQDWMQYLS